MGKMPILRVWWIPEIFIFYRWLIPMAQNTTSQNPILINGGVKIERAMSMAIFMASISIETTATNGEAKVREAARLLKPIVAQVNFQSQKRKPSKTLLKRRRTLQHF